jgi:RNA 2',3'-cyclic 3'-phosphodiesterase
MLMATTRCFIAIDLSDHLKARLQDLEQQMQNRIGRANQRAVRWTTPGNIHLTLKFLGDTQNQILPVLQKTLEEATRHKPFAFTASGVGAFPNARRPRVLWVGLDAPPQLIDLQRAVDTVTRPLGFAGEDRPYAPHLTIGRINQNARPEEIEAVALALRETQVGDLGTVQVNQFHLYKSELQPSGAVYTRLHHFNLAE